MPEPFDLRYSDWIPFRRRSGRVDIGSPSLITDSIDEDPVVAIASPRPDFDGAVQEFLIGLLTTALQPAEEKHWRAYWKEPPSPSVIATALQSLPEAFSLDGHGFRFLQDTAADELAALDLQPVQDLIIPMAGANSHPFDTHPFVKTHRIAVLGLPAAAMALLTLQTYAPAGGRGHRTSLRGGGPLTTLVDPRLTGTGAQTATEQPLWQKLWANVETEKQWSSRSPRTGDTQFADVFPWMASTRVSSKPDGRPTTPLDAHSLQVYYGMPRRVLLEFGTAGVCDLTHQQYDSTVTGFRMKAYGVEYESWRHPLSPYYQKKSAYLPVHAQPGGIGWKDWLGFTLRTPDGTREPAQCVAHFLQERALPLGLVHLRIHAFGYDMSNMKARDWTDATLPVIAARTADHASAIRQLAASLVAATELAVYALRSSIDRALYERPEDVPGDRSFAPIRLWHDTEATFYASIQELSSSHSIPQDGVTIREAFLSRLSSAAQRIFDGTIRSGEMQGSPRRVVAARYELVSALNGRSKLGKKLYKAMDLQPPQREDAAQQRAADPAQEATDVE